MLQFLGSALRTMFGFGLTGTGVKIMRTLGTVATGLGLYQGYDFLKTKISGVDKNGKDVEVYKTQVPLSIERTKLMDHMTTTLRKAFNVSVDDLACLALWSHLFMGLHPRTYYAPEESKNAAINTLAENAHLIAVTLPGKSEEVEKNDIIEHVKLHGASEADLANFDADRVSGLMSGSVTQSNFTKTDVAGSNGSSEIENLNNTRKAGWIRPLGR